MLEEWRDIDGYPGYQVSNTGKVRSFVNNRHGIGSQSHELRPCSTKTGHMSVQLGRKNRKTVHRLVANAYIPNPNNYPLVRHLDDNPQNNHADNLAWGTQTHNMQDCVKHGRLVGDTSAAIEATKKGVVAISLDGKTRLEFLSIAEAARALDLWPQHICRVAQGTLRQTGGWVFEYADKEVIRHA